MKRKLILIASVLTLFLVFAFPCLAKEQNHVTDNFDSYISKCNEKGIWNAQPVVFSDGTGSAIIGAGNGQTLYAQTVGFTTDVTGLYASFSVKFNENVNQHVIFGASTDKTPVSPYNRVLQFYSGGKKLQIANETNINMPYTTGIWYDVELELTYSTGAYRLSVTPRGGGTQIRSFSSTKLAKPDDVKLSTKYYAFWIDNNTASESVQIDNVNIYGMTEYRSLCFYINQDKYALNGNVFKLDNSNGKVITTLINSSTYAPADVLCDNLYLTYSISDNICKISNANTSLSLSDGEYAYYENKLYIPIRKVSEYFGYKITYDKSGLIVVSEIDNYFNLNSSDISLFRDLTYSLCCDEPTVDEVYSSITSGNLSHPRIILNNELLASLKNNISAYPRMAYWYEQIKDKAKALLNTPCLSYNPDSYSGILDAAQKARTRIPQLALVYLVEGDEAYAQRAVSEMLSLSSFPDWYPYRALDTAEMNLAVGIGYDWLYNYMKEKNMASQMETIKNALIQKGLNVVMEDYTGNYTWFNESGESRSTKFTKLGDNPHNWVYVCNAGAIVGALSVADEAPDLSSKIVSYAVKNWGKALRFLAPDGVHYEGPMYNNWMLISMANAFSSLENTFGTSFGLMDMPGVTEFPYFNMSFISSDLPFNFGNSDSLMSNINSNGTFYIASYANDIALGSLRSSVLMEHNLSIGVQDLIYAKPEFFMAEKEILNDAAYISPNKYSIFTLRSSDAEKKINLAAVGGTCNEFEQADSGSFIIDAFDTRFACDMGKGVYEGEWFDKYKHRAEGHNVIVINPDETSGFKENTLPKLESFYSDKDESYAVYDLTKSYGEKVKSAKRGYYLSDREERIIIQDEVIASDASEMYWFMHTQCEIELSQDKKEAVLKGDTKNMHLRIDCNADAEFTVMDAKLLPSSPQTDKSTNNGYKKLAIHLTDVTELSLSVVMDFEYPYVSLDNPMPERKAISSWQLTDDTQDNSPKLDMIYFNGVEFNEFQKDKYSYKCTLPCTAHIPEITADGSGTVSVSEISSAPTTCIITVTGENGAKTEYGITFEYISEGSRSETALNVDRCAFPIFLVSSHKPQNNSNLVDRDIESYCLTEGEQLIDFDLGENKLIDRVMIYVKHSLIDSGKQIFDVCISEDGANWTKVVNNAHTDGLTEKGEVFSFNPQIGTYVRLKLHGNTVNSQNVISEFRIFGEK